MAGITRIKIESDWHDWRVQMAEDLAPAANEIYRVAFAKVGTILLPGEEILKCTKDEAMSRYDWKEGIDVILTAESGTRATLQEKFLDYHEDTITFEERKTSGDPGAWYYCTAQYYFTGYARRYRAESIYEFQSWMLIDLPSIHRASDMGLVPWGNSFTRTTDNPLGLRQNGRDGRRATFRFVYFNVTPTQCIVARSHIQQTPTHPVPPKWEATQTQPTLFSSQTAYDLDA
jgi:hypothetical protein